jgi:hypothetical protein
MTKWTENSESAVNFVLLFFMRILDVIKYFKHLY